jgi:hypothetical protein
LCLENDIYELRKNPKRALPWTPSQYQEAILSVDRSIEDDKQKILQFVEKICTENSQEVLMPLFEMMINKIQSNYSQVLRG